MPRGWHGDPEGHRKAAMKGHRGTTSRAKRVKEGERVPYAREGKGIYKNVKYHGPYSLEYYKHESRSIGAKKAAAARKKKTEVTHTGKQFHVKAGTAEAKRRGRKAAATRRSRVQTTNGYNIDAMRELHGPRTVPVLTSGPTAEMRARREAQYRKMRETLQ